MLTVVLTSLLAVGEELLQYPGAVYAGSVTSTDETRCRLVVWDGLAPYLPLLFESEQKQLEVILNDAKSKWLADDSWPRRAALLSPYSRLLFDKSRDFPFQRKEVGYQQFALSCGGERVRGASAWFPPMGAGGFLVLKHAEEPEYLVLVDFEPRAKEHMEELSAFVAKYRAELEKAETPEELPREIQKEVARVQKKFAEKSRQRVQFWDVNGIVLPSCPGGCPPGTLSNAFAHLSPKTRRGFGAALGLFAATWSDDNEKALGGRLRRFSDSWPDELGENTFLGAREEMKRSQKELLSFTPPPADVTEELWGRRKPTLPTFNGDLRQAIRAVLRSFLPVPERV